MDLVGELTHLDDQQIQDVFRALDDGDLLPAVAGDEADAVNRLAERIPSLPRASGPVVRARTQRARSAPLGVASRCGMACAALTALRRPPRSPAPAPAQDPGRLVLEASLTVRGKDEGVPYVLTDRKIDVEVVLLTDAGELAAQSPMQLEVEIVYEDGLPVDELANANHKPLLQLLGTQPLWAVAGRCRFEVKLHVLSSMRNNKLFRLRISADEKTRRDWPALVCQTDPAVKTLSKDPRKKKIGTDAASRAARRASLEAEMQRRQQDGAGGAAGTRAEAAAPASAAADEAGGSTAADLEKEELRAMLAQQEERIRQLTEDNKRMVDELQARRKEQGEQGEQPPSDAA